MMPVDERDLGLAAAGGRGKLRVGIRPPNPATAENDPAADPAVRAAAFLKRADIDGDGKLSPEEIRAGLGNRPSVEQVAVAIKRFDTDGDRALNLEEATAAVKSLR